MMPVSSEERVLVLSLADTAAVRALAQGQALVGVGTADEVRAARRAFADLENVMFVPGSRDEIPWQPAWFTLIVDPQGGPATEAMLRALAEGGRIVSGSQAAP